MGKELQTLVIQIIYTQAKKASFKTEGTTHAETAMLAQDGAFCPMRWYRRLALI